MRARRTLATTLARVSRRGLHGGPFGAAGAAGAVDEPPTEFFESCLLYTSDAADE